MLGKKFILLKDNMCIMNLFTQPRVNSRKERWMSFLTKLDFEVRHIRGMENRVVDALSQRTHEFYEVTMIQLESDLLSIIKTATVLYVDYINLLNKIQNTEVNLKGRQFSVDLKGLTWINDKGYML